MSRTQLSVNHGSVGATTIVSSLDSSGLAATRFVTLSGNYARVIPPGYPDPNAGALPSASKTAAAQTIANGTRVKFFADEAAALVAASAGAYS